MRVDYDRRVLGQKVHEVVNSVGTRVRALSPELRVLLLLLALGGAFMLFVLLPAYWSPTSRVYASLGYPAVMRAFGRPIEVEVESVQRRPMSRTIAAEGTTGYLNEVPVHSEVPGIVTDLRVEAGQRVTTGDVLLYVNPGGHTTRMFTLRRQLRKRELEQARVRLARQRLLFRQKVISRDELEDAQIELRRAETASNLSLEEYAHSLRSRSATVTGEPPPWAGMPADQKVEIIATVSGTVLKRNIRQGENLIDLRNPLLVIGDQLVFEAHIDQRYSGMLQSGDRGRLYLRAHPGTEVPVKVVRLGHNVEAAAQRPSKGGGPPPFTFSVWLSIPDSLVSQGRLLPGMTGYTVFDQKYTGLAVPERALIRYSGRSGTVLTVDSAHRVQIKSVTYTGSEKGWITIESADLPEGSLVVVSGQSALKAGDKVALPPSVRTALH